MTSTISIKDNNGIIEQKLNQIFKPEWLRERAKATGFIKRNRKIDPVIIFWVFTLGIGVQLKRTIAGLVQLYEEKANIHLARSSFYERFTPALTRFLHGCVLHALSTIAQNTNRKLKEKIAAFKDLLIQDSSVIRLYNKLAGRWPAAGGKTVAAGVKISLLVSAVIDGPKRVAIHGERTSEVKLLRIGQWVKDRILLIDLGYYKHYILAKIDEYKGFFVSRVKKNVNFLIVGINRPCHGRSMDVVGKKLNEVLPRIRRKVLDVMVEVKFKRKTLRGKRRTDTKCFRLIAIYNPETKKYHVYITNIPVTTLDAEDIALLYSARWEIELIFKELKSKYGINILPSSNPTIVTALLWASILTFIVSRIVYLLIYSSDLKNAHRYTHLRWATVFAKNSERLLDAVLQHAGYELSCKDLFEVLQCQAVDPNINRKGLMNPWIA